MTYVLEKLEAKPVAVKPASMLNITEGR